MKRVALASLLVLGLGLSAATAQAAHKQRVGRTPRVRASATAYPLANYGYANYGYGYGYPAYGYGYPAYGYGYPVFSVGFANLGGLQGYDYTTDPFGGSPYGGNYDYWLTQQAAHGNISWAQANHRMHGQ